VISRWIFANALGIIIIASSAKAFEKPLVDLTGLQNQKIGRIGTNMLCLTPEAIFLENSFFRFPYAEINQRYDGFAQKYLQGRGADLAIAGLVIKACYPRFGLKDRLTLKGAVEIQLTLTFKADDKIKGVLKVEGTAMRKPSAKVAMESLILSAFDNALAKLCEIKPSAGFKC
jgi:hypothetical protein